MNKLSEPFNYENDYNFALNDPISFWEKVASKYIFWDKKYEIVYNGNEIDSEWFKGGLMNTCYNVLDIQAKNPLKKDLVAIVYECPFLKKTTEITYIELYERVCEFSRVLLNLEISKNDKVIIHMPKSIEGIVGILACSRIGATYCPLFDCNSHITMVDRLDSLCPKLILTSNYEISNNGISNEETVIPLSPCLIKALEISNHKPNHIISHNRKDFLNEIVSNIPIIENSLDWEDLVLKSKGNPFYDYIPVDSSHPLYILYTSGTTGNSKPVVRDNAGHLVASRYYWNISFEETDKQLNYFSFSPMGWVSFQSTLFSILGNGDKFVISEGVIASPNYLLNNIWEIIERNQINYLLSATRLMRLIIKLDPNANFIKKYNISKLKSIMMGGDIVDSNTIDYYENKLNVQIVDAYGQTEANIFLLSNLWSDYSTTRKLCKPFIFIRPSLFSENGIELGDNEIGELAFKLPMPPGFATTFYNNHEQYLELFSKFKGYYFTGDMATRDENGYYQIMSRSDDIIKYNGVRIQLVKIEQTILKHPNVLDCCCISMKYQISGEAPMGILVLNNDNTNNPITDLKQFENEINELISKYVDKNAILRKLLIVNSIPKTKTGKFTRSIISSILYEPNYKIPNSFEDLESLNEIITKFKSN